jgi:hypothetical protein
MLYQQRHDTFSAVRGSLLAAVRHHTGISKGFARRRNRRSVTHRSHCWTWVYCENCLHHAPMALVPLIIRWGADTSSDRLRRSARCTECGHKGATLQHPGWGGNHVGFLPFPAEKLAAHNASQRPSGERWRVPHG